MHVKFQKTVTFRVTGVTKALFTLITVPSCVSSGTVPTPALRNFDRIMCHLWILHELGPLGRPLYFLELYDPISCFASSTLNSFKVSFFQLQVSIGKEDRSLSQLGRR